MLQISPDKAPDGAMTVIVIKNRKAGEELNYTIADEWLPKIFKLDQIRSVRAV